MQVEDPVAAYQLRVAEIAERARQAREQVARIQPSVTSDDGAVTVRVSAAGALAGIEFGSSAADIELPELASLILRTAQAARVRAANQTQQTLAGLVGESGAAMTFIRSQLSGLGETEPDLSTAATRPAFTGASEDGFVERSRL